MAEAILRLQPDVMREIALSLDLDKLIDLCQQYDFLGNILCNNESFLIELTRKYLVRDPVKAKEFVNEYRKDGVIDMIAYLLRDYRYILKVYHKLASIVDIKKLSKYWTKYDVLVDDFILNDDYLELFRNVLNSYVTKDYRLVYPILNQLSDSELEKLVDDEKTLNILEELFQSLGLDPYSINDELFDQLVQISFDKNKYNLNFLLTHRLTEEDKKLYSIIPRPASHPRFLSLRFIPCSPFFINI